MTISVKARTAGVFYLLTVVTGALALAFDNGRLIANLIATAWYIVVTILFYQLFMPVNKRLSLVAAFFSFVGCPVGALGAFDLAPLPLNSLVFFGCYCVLTGYLIFRSTFLPRILGVMMALGGLGWLTYLSSPLAASLFPYNMASAIIAETLLTLWLLVFGVNVQRWNEQAGARGNLTQ